MKYVKLPIEIEATQWFKNGDHPKDYEKERTGFEDGNIRTWQGSEAKELGWEGGVVRYYRTPNDPGTRECEQCRETMRYHGWIDTLEGGHIVCPGDWIITGVKGETYPCKPDIFAATHRPAAITASMGDITEDALNEMIQDAGRHGTGIVRTYIPLNEIDRRLPIDLVVGEVKEVDPKTHPRGEPIDTSDIPEANEEWFKGAQWKPDQITAMREQSEADRQFHAAIRTLQGYKYRWYRERRHLEEQLRCEGEHTAAAQKRIEELESTLRHHADAVASMRHDLEEARTEAQSANSRLLVLAEELRDAKMEANLADRGDD